MIWTLFGVVTAALADDDLSLRFSKEIQTEPRSQEELIAVPIDSDVYAATKNDFADLRIIDAQGQAVPFVLQKATETKPQIIRHSWKAAKVSLKPLQDEGLEILVQLDEKDEQPNGVRLITPLKNFEQRVRVFGKRNGEEEKPLVPEGVVFDYSQYMDVSQNEIRLPKSTDREFRIVIDGLTSDQESQLLDLARKLRSGKEEERTERTTIQRRPFRIDRIEFWSEETQRNTVRDKTANYPVKEFRVSEDKEQHQTVIEVHTRREPIVLFRVETAGRNFSRRAVVQVPETRGVKTDWREIGRATVSRFEFRDLRQEHLEIALPETRQETFRIRIDNRDSQPLEITGVEAEGHIDQVVFLAAANGSYRIRYAADESEVPQYDTAAIRAALGRGFAPLAAKLGPERASFSAEPPPVNLKKVLNNPFVLGGIVCLLVAVLAWGLFQASRRIEQIPKDDPGG